MLESPWDGVLGDAMEKSSHVIDPHPLLPPGVMSVGAPRIDFRQGFYGCYQKPNLMFQSGTEREGLGKYADVGKAIE